MDMNNGHIYIYWYPINMKIFDKYYIYIYNVYM